MELLERMERLQEAEPSAESSRNTVVVSGVPTDVLPADRMLDKLIVHFQNRRRSDGGDVKRVRFPTDSHGLAFITFEDGTDAEKVARRRPQIMTDDEFPEEYELTVFPFSEDVFFYVSNATLDLSVFHGDHEALLRGLRSRHTSIRFGSLSGKRTALIEGPFTAAKALREELICRAARLQKYDGRHAAVEEGVCEDGADAEQREADLTETPLGRVGDAARLEERGGAGSVADAFSDRKKETLQRQVEGEESALTPPPPADPPAPPQEGAEPQRREGQEGAESQRRDGQEGAEPQRQEVLDLSVTESVSVSPWSDVIGPEEMWVDLMTFRYVDAFQKTALNACLGRVLMSHDSFEEDDLVRVSLSEAPPPRGRPAVREASENLQTLLDTWQRTLTVHQFKAEPHDHAKLNELCVSSALLYDDVLYTIRGSEVKVIGPSTSSFLFYRRVRGGVTDSDDL